MAKSESTTSNVAVSVRSYKRKSKPMNILRIGRRDDMPTTSPSKILATLTSYISPGMTGNSHLGSVEVSLEYRSMGFVPLDSITKSRQRKFYNTKISAELR